MKDQLDNFERGYMPEPNTGCWLWFRASNSDGYGKICGFGDGTSRLAHRWAYEYFRGPIPSGLVLDHLCRTPCCVNPAHLEAVSQAENIARADNYLRRQTHCLRGHPLSGANLYITKVGSRWCRACDVLRSREKRRRARA